MKHAYLIIAHNEFPVLDKLIQALDDSRNDIFIHYDKKLEEYPRFGIQNAGLFILDKRVDVRWGDVSVVEAEYVLFEAASKQGRYGYYHLLSGVDMPLKSQDEIHQFFEDNQGKEFIGFSRGDLSGHIDRKARRYHLFPKSFRPESGLRAFCQRAVRFIFLRLQLVCGLRRNRNIELRKGTQWVSVTDSFVRYMLSKKEEVLKTYHHTFCSDEIFLQTLCWNSNFRERVFDIDNEGHGCMRKIGWKNNRLEDWTDGDYMELSQSECMFARKFNSDNLDIVDQILDKIANRN